MQMLQDVNYFFERPDILGFQVTGSDLIVNVVIFSLIISWCVYIWNRRHYEKLASKIPGPPAYPIVGSMLQFIGKPRYIIKQINKLIDTYGGEPFKLWFCGCLTVVISKPEDVQIILNSSKALQKSFLFNFGKLLLGDGLFTAPVDKWRIHRRMLSPAFKTENLRKMFFPVIVENSEALIRDLKKQLNETQPFNLLDYVSDTTFRTIYQTTLGCNFDIEPKVEAEFKKLFDRAVELISERLFKPWLYPDFIYSIYSKFTGQQNVYKNAQKLPNYMIDEMKKMYAENKTTKKANINCTADVTVDDEKKKLKVYMDILMELNESGNHKLSDEDFKSEVITILGAGIETTSSTICFCILLLAIHQDIQDKVYDEIYKILGDNKTITFEDTANFVYLKQVIQETLRLFPLTLAFMKEIQDDIKIFSGNYVLPKGTTCLICPLAIHYLPTLYPNPRSFNPGNFDSENIAKRNKYSFIAFGGGKRNCIGEKFAMLNMIVFIATFLRNYSVHTDIKFNDIKLKIRVIMTSKSGYPVTIRPRHQK
ncbi:Cytochrome P450, E-class, group I,Cytochrome P450,Cytochrome P450, conserved site [Cinara cedri]|uniref:Cytochrome P450, E-class, group I,Cytochrome P450,Cytochrome P450, conserved site n=1 Tax=Cinara cedri TaxID=506608 RepID=A0A5E4N3G8_9HEMI|nr:Cytochrome P450, E-class, group I,Cytochrome P450,Cytochrome P450, conserved site [Cinara cedri]